MQVARMIKNVGQSKIIKSIKARVQRRVFYYWLQLPTDWHALHTVTYGLAGTKSKLCNHPYGRLIHHAMRGSAESALSWCTRCILILYWNRGDGEQAVKHVDHWAVRSW